MKNTQKKKLDSNMYVKKEYQIDEIDEHGNYLSESSFTTPFKSKLKAAQVSRNQTEKKDTAFKSDEHRMTLSF